MSDLHKLLYDYHLGVKHDVEIAIRYSHSVPELDDKLNRRFALLLRKIKNKDES